MSTNVEIPAPVSVKGPSPQDLEKDALFLQDFQQGFLTRGVTPGAVGEEVRVLRRQLISFMREVLVEFVDTLTDRKQAELQKTSSGGGGGGGSGALVSDGLSFAEDTAARNTLLSSWADVRPYGSVAIGADLVDSDVDLVCLAPDHITRDDFLSEFPSFMIHRLEVKKKQLVIKDLVAIRAAKVPVISFTVSHQDVSSLPAAGGGSASNLDEKEETSQQDAFGAGGGGGEGRRRRREGDEKEEQQQQGAMSSIAFTTTEVDLIFVGVSKQLDHPPENEELRDIERMMQIVPAEYRLSINGVRTALEMQRLNPSTVPDTFRVVVTAIKSWAIIRGVAGNNFCFPGGVAWAVLVTRVLQMFPNDVCAGLFGRFFQFWCLWLANAGAAGKPSSKAVKLTVSMNPYPHLPRVEGMPPTWDVNISGTGGSSSSNLSAAGSDLFPVLNPAFPHLNTTHTMSLSTVTALGREFARALELLKQQPQQQNDDDEDGGASSSSMQQQSIPRPWRLLFTTPYVIWKEYRSFIIVEVASIPNMNIVINQEQQQRRSFLEWSRFVESRLKVLIYALDSSGAIDCRPVCESFRGDDLDKSHLPPRPVPQGYAQRQQQQRLARKRAPPPRADNTTTTDPEEPVIQEHVEPECRTFFVVGIRPIQQQQQQQSSDLTSISAALKCAIDEFLFSVSSDAQQQTMSSNAASTSFRHSESMLRPELSVVGLRELGSEAATVPPMVDLEQSRMNALHSEDLVRELLRISTPSAIMAEQSSPRRNRD